MTLAPWFAEILALHVGAVTISGTLFAVRGIGRMAGWRRFDHAAVRYFSYANDTVLLVAAILLTTIIHEYPLANAWLTVKVMLLAVYIVLGAIALHHGRTGRIRAWAFVGALATFAFIVSVAVTQNPWGALAWLAARTA